MCVGGGGGGNNKILYKIIQRCQTDRHLGRKVSRLMDGWMDGFYSDF